MSDPNVVLTAPDTTGLPDIAEASFGPLRPGMNPLDDPIVEAPPAPEVVFGTDDRIQILNTADYPRYVWALFIELPR